MANDDLPTDTRAVTVRAGVKPQALVPATMEEAWRIATAVAKSGLAPKDMQEPEQILVAIMHGLEIGLPPLAAVQRIAVINGRPSIWGDAAIGLVQASGQLEDIQETIEGEGDQRVAICRAVRKGRKTPIVGRFSVADAQRAGLWDTRTIVKKKDRNGSWYEKTNDAPWYRFPERMLQMRARGFCLRDGFADVLGGLYLREELEEEIRDVTPPDQQPSQPARPAGPPRGVQEPKVIEHVEVTDSSGSVFKDLAVEEPNLGEIKPTEDDLNKAAIIKAAKETGATVIEEPKPAGPQAGGGSGDRELEGKIVEGPRYDEMKRGGPPRGVSKAPPADPRKAYKWPEIQALFRNQANMAIDLGNIEPLEQAHANLVDQYEFLPDELDELNKIFDSAEQALN